MSRQDSSGLRTLLVGVDGACLPVVEPSVESGRLQVLGDLLERGASGLLESRIPPWIPSAWPALYTATNPGKHGVFDFLASDDYDDGPTERTDDRRVEQQIADLDDT